MSELSATGLEKSYRKRKVVSSLSISIGVPDGGCPFIPDRVGQWRQASR